MALRFVPSIPITSTWVGVPAASALTDPPLLAAAAEAVAVITRPRRLRPTAGDTVDDAPPLPETTGVMPRVDKAAERASAAGLADLRTAAAGLRIVDGFAGLLTAPAVVERLRAFGPALGELAFDAPADGPAVESGESA
ncbi:hypothetical protein MAIC_50480 [Mycolicibacterium aichiense]|uniref:Uncharacterized protein n=1 Tax=Mycolicibacterium aichiense TaxID=1799 RepID=A0AAD1MF33_9MYCO|nr:hypothetical protein MAIC_50480 [Mycolicibacterium aichiense]